MSYVVALLFASVLFAPAALARPAGPYVDLEAYASRADAVFDNDMLADQLKSLKRQFEFICGDTFCEGEYSNLASMEFNCSVQTHGTGIADCVWSFAGSYSRVRQNDGSVRVKARFYHCHVPLEGDVGQLKDFLIKASHDGMGYHGLHDTVIPGSTGKTLMNVLGACF